MLRKKGGNVKKVIGIVIASLVFCNIGYAKMRVLEEAEVGVNETYTACIDGYKFVMFNRYAREGTSMVQFFVERDGKSLPAKCTFIAE